MTGKISQPPPLLWLAPQSDHGSAACAETEAFFHYGPQSFFEPSWLALPKARAREVGATMMTGRKFLRPPLLWLAIRSRECRVKLFSSMARCNAFSSLTQLARLAYKKHARGKLAQRVMTGRKFLSPPLLWLAPQSDHGSAARAETEAVFQYGPPQSDCGGGKLTPRCSIGAGGCAESILDQGNPKPGKG